MIAYQPVSTDPLALIRSVAKPTPVDSLALGDGIQVLVKREDLGPTGTFKWRGALAACSAYRAAGETELVTASTGNHGAAVAWAAARLQLRAEGVVPRNAATSKCEILAAHGAELHRVGEDLDEAAAPPAELHRERGVPSLADRASLAP